jgi:uncharacterized protein
MKNRTLIIGASENPQRYSYLAIRRLLSHNKEVRAVGLKKGAVDGVTIETGQPIYQDIDTVTLYVGANNQAPLFDYILRLKPRRVIFNPGTENPELEDFLKRNGIATEEACTLVMLSTGVY